MEETYDIQPNSTQGIILPEGFNFKVIGISNEEIEIVEDNILPTGERMALLKNTSDHVVSVIKYKNENN